MFEGDGYSDDWAKEAQKRGLSNLKTTPEALEKKWTKIRETLRRNGRFLSCRSRS